MTGTERLAQLAKGENPRLVLQMPSGFAVMSDHQFLPGYCLLLAYPEVSQLTDLKGPARLAYLQDVALLGEAIQAATGALRMNFAIYGNVDPFLHAHVWPRYSWEEDPYRTMPPLNIPATHREDPSRAYNPSTHDALRDKIRAELQSRI